MKKFVLMAMVAALVVPAIAAPTVYLTTKTGNSPAYTVNLNDAADSLWTTNGITTGFETFCVEWDKGFYAGSNHTYWATIDDAVMFGGGNDLLKDETKQIYAAFLNGSIGITDSRVQNAIWYWESGKQVSVVDVNSTTHNLSDQGLVLAELNITGWQNVKVLNLWENANLSGRDVQSQLVMVTPIPAPGAILLTGIGTTLVGWLRRRRSL